MAGFVTLLSTHVVVAETTSRCITVSDHYRHGQQEITFTNLCDHTIGDANGFAITIRIPKAVGPIRFYNQAHPDHKTKAHIVAVSPNDGDSAHNYYRIQYSKDMHNHAVHFARGQSFTILAAADNLKRHIAVLGEKRFVPLQCYGPGVVICG